MQPQVAHDPYGFIKLVAESATKWTLGANVVVDAGEDTQWATLAVKLGMPLDDFAGTPDNVISNVSSHEFNGEPVLLAYR